MAPKHLTLSQLAQARQAATTFAERLLADGGASATALAPTRAQFAELFIQHDSGPTFEAYLERNPTPPTLELIAGRTEITVDICPSEALGQPSALTDGFPSDYERVAPYLTRGVVWVTITFAVPGSQSAYEALFERPPAPAPKAAEPAGPGAKAAEPKGPASKAADFKGQPSKMGEPKGPAPKMPAPKGPAPKTTEPKGPAPKMGDSKGAAPAGGDAGVDAETSAVEPLADSHAIDGFAMLESGIVWIPRPWELLPTPVAPEPEESPEPEPAPPVPVGPRAGGPSPARPNMPGTRPAPTGPRPSPVGPRPAPAGKPSPTSSPARPPAPARTGGPVPPHGVPQKPGHTPADGVPGQGSPGRNGGPRRPE
jgi:hypothetical protein